VLSEGLRASGSEPEENFSTFSTPYPTSNLPRNFPIAETEVETLPVKEDPGALIGRHSPPFLSKERSVDEESSF
jgi:hypothetical protein